MEFYNTNVTGIESIEEVIGSRKTKQAVIKAAIMRGSSDISVGADKYLKTIIVKTNVKAPVAFWLELLTKLNDYTTLRTLEFWGDLLENWNPELQFEDSVDPRIIEIIKEKREALLKDSSTKKLDEFIKSLPLGTMVDQIIVMNYYDLKQLFTEVDDNMLYNWPEFITFVSTLSYFLDFTGCKIEK